MSELPTGTVTFLFTDIEGSTRLLHELGDAYADALAEHRRVLRELFARHGGVEVDTQAMRSSSRSGGPRMRSPPRAGARPRSPGARFEFAWAFIQASRWQRTR